MNFSELDLGNDILRTLERLEYTTPTPIQQQAIPVVLEGRDLMACAQTGTGKTAAFSLPILRKLGRPSKGEKRPVRALILTPTRELALQIYENLCEYGRYTGRISTVIYGGVSQVPQVQALRRGVDVLVATPGRLWDLMQQNVLRIDEVEYFVLDEADRMLDMGFINDVRRILPFLPANRQTLLFSATMPKEIVDLAQTILKDPASVSVAPSAKPIEVIEQGVYFVDKMEKRKFLQVLLQDRSLPQTLVFTRTKHGADRVTKELNRAGISAMAIHGDKSQGARQNALKAFKDYKIAVLVATDIAARGIDIDDLPLVVNFDLPNEPETYVHRIGRTGRRGQSGTALSFCDQSELEYLAAIEKITKIVIPELLPPEGIERNEMIAEGRYVNGMRPRSSNRVQKRVTTPRPAAQPAPQTGEKRAKRTDAERDAVKREAKKRSAAVAESGLPTRLNNQGMPVAKRSNQPRGGQGRAAQDTRNKRTPAVAQATIAEKPARREVQAANAAVKSPNAGARKTDNRPRNNNRGGAPRRGGRNAKFDENELRMDVVTPRSGQLADSTAARIRAKIEAKLAERATTEIPKATSNRTGSSRARRARQK